MTSPGSLPEMDWIVRRCGDLGQWQAIQIFPRRSVAIESIAHDTPTGKKKQTPPSKKKTTTTTINKQTKNKQTNKQKLSQGLCFEHTLDSILWP